MRTLWIGLLGFTLVWAAAAAGGERHPLAGSWHVEGQARLRHLGGRPLALDGVWDEALGDVALAAEGPGLVLSGRTLTGARRSLELELRRLPGERLEAVLRADGAELARERWSRLGPPRLELLGVAPLASGAVAIDFAVSGRPQAVLLRVRAREGDERFAPLEGLLHEETLAGGAPLAVGRHRARWDGRDRSLEERPVEPGAWAIELAPADGSALGRAPGERAEAPAASPAPPGPRLAAPERGAVEALEQD